jgi:indolepyruvate ferredoxin oxidoreductase
VKRLRGTPLDPFGYTAERRMERELIGWYERKVEAALARLSSETHEALCALMEKPMQIRGYGPVKEDAARKVRAEMEAGLPG